MRGLFLSFITTCWLLLNLSGQEEKPVLYNPEADARAEMQAAAYKAKAEGKHVLLQIGGNWCPWCIRFHRFIHDDKQVDSLLKADYIFQLINYSKENKNPEILAELKFPQRFGFPVLVVLDGNLNLLHTQNSAYLEKDKSYDRDKVIEFLNHWKPSALKPENYP